MGSYLSVTNVTVAYGKSIAVHDISFAMSRGDTVGIIGRNGAGKSSLVRALFGLAPLKAGNVTFQGEDVTKVPAHARAAMGMALVPEGRGTFPQMSVAENLEMGAYAIRDKAAFRSILGEVFDYFPILRERLGQKASTLSGGEQQMLAIGRALMSQPSLLVMDEPSLGLAPLVIEALAEILVKIHRSGKSIILVEQNASLALGLSNECLVIENGALVLKGTREAVAKDEVLRDAFLGASA